MGKIADEGTVHLEVDLDGRAAQLGMRGGGGVRGGEPAKPRYITGQFDDALVVDVVQHRSISRGAGLDRPGDRPWRLQCIALYMVGNGGNTAAISPRPE